MGDWKRAKVQGKTRTSSLLIKMGTDREPLISPEELQPITIYIPDLQG